MNRHIHYIFLFLTGIAAFSRTMAASGAPAQISSLYSASPVISAPLPPGTPGTGTLSGRITGKDGAPLPGASVYIPDLKLGVVADTAGYYKFNSLPSGKYLIEVHSIGFKAITRSVTVSGPVTQNFTLSDEFVEESPVVVTGLSKATQIKRSPVPIVAITHTYLVTNLSTNAIDAIAKIPGIRAVTTGPNVSKPFIRGLGYNRILTLYDGIRQEGQQWGDEHGIEVDQYGMERVEVIKGPASLSFGSDALAGVVNLIPTQPAPEGKMIGNLTLDYQTNNKYAGGSAMLGATKNGLEWMARISHKQAIDYQDKIDGRVFGTAFNETDANASFGLHRKWGYSHLDFVLYDDLQEIPDGSRDSATHRFTRQVTEKDSADRQVVSDADLNTYHIETLHQHVQHYRLYSGNSFILGNAGRLQVNLGYQRSIRREFSHPEAGDIPGLYLKLSSLTYDIKYFLPDFNNWNITVGLNGMYQDNNSTDGTEFIIPSYHQFDLGPFFLVKRSFDKLDISGGLRFDTRSFNNFQLYTATNPVTKFDMPVYGADTSGADKVFPNYSKTFTGYSGSIGATYNFSEHFSAKANIARGFRAPNIAEISANGVHPGTNIYQLGNPNFKPEFSLQEDIGFVYSSHYIVATLDLFNNFINNYIYNRKVLGPNGTFTDSSGNSYFQFVASKARLYGGEFSIDIHPVRALHFENSISVVYGTNKGEQDKALGDSAKYLPFIPPTHGISELRYEFNVKPSHIAHAFVKIQVEYYAAQNRAFIAYNTETPTAAYTLVNTGMGGGFTNKQGKTIVNVYLNANNLFDVAYYDHLSRLKYFLYSASDTNPTHGIYNMGRNLSLKLDFPLDFSLKKGEERVN